jgi:hypothetical protein
MASKYNVSIGSVYGQSITGEHMTIMQNGLDQSLKTVLSSLRTSVERLPLDEHSPVTPAIKNEVLENVSTLDEQAGTPPEQRDRGTIERAIAFITSTVQTLTPIVSLAISAKSLFGV